VVIRTRSERRTGRTSPGVPFLLEILSMIGMLVPFSISTASTAPPELQATVVWVRGDRVYVASEAPLALEEGDLLTFRSHGKEIASGRVVDVHDEAMIVAALTSGSLRKEKKLEKIRIVAQRPPVRPLSSLRVGCPSELRRFPLFDCESATIGASLPKGAYRADTLGQRSYRFVRDSTVVTAAPWPDTLLVRAFDESADEEIALERREVDVAVFWPGELSTRLREDARWSGFAYGTRSHGLLVASGLDRTAANALRALDAMNRALFRGDLGAWTQSGPRSGPPDTSSVAHGPDVSIRVDPSLPGALEIERALNPPKSSPASTPGITGRMIYFAGADPSPEARASMPSAFVAEVRCPVVSDPKLRAMIGALGAAAFADLLGCGVLGR